MLKIKKISLTLIPLIISSLLIIGKTYACPTFANTQELVDCLSKKMEEEHNTDNNNQCLTEQATISVTDYHRNDYHFFKRYAYLWFEESFAEISKGVKIDENNIQALTLQQNGTHCTYRFKHPIIHLSNRQILNTATFVLTVPTKLIDSCTFAR